MILFGNLDLAEKALINPLEILNQKFDYDGKNEDVYFIGGISNYSLDIDKTIEY